MKKELKDTIIVELGEKLKEYPHFYLVDLTAFGREEQVAAQGLRKFRDGLHRSV